MNRLLGLFLLLIGLTGCSEPDQSLYSSNAKVDGKPWLGAQDPFVAAGWQAGDKTRWENQLKQRAQTQNEYLRVH